MTAPRQLETRRGTVPFPAYIPVTTFGERYPLDGLIRPYLARLAPAVMVSHFYARQMKTHERPSLPMFVDSGGFASLFKGACVTRTGSLGIIEHLTPEGNQRTHPADVLEFQEDVADVAFTLDFPIPPGLARADAKIRQELTIANAAWAASNRRRKDLPLFACVQGWDAASYRRCAAAYADLPVEGLAIGGLVPRLADPPLIRTVIDGVLEEARGRPVHVFGVGKPELVRELFAAGVSSVDSSSYVKAAADGKAWDSTDVLEDATPAERLDLAIRNLAAATATVLPLSARFPRRHNVSAGAAESRS